MNLENLFPLIVPSSYYVKDVWELPHYPLPNKDFLLTWVFISKSGGMVYITNNDFEELNSKHDGWQQKAMDNMRNSITENENFFTEYSSRILGNGLKFIVFMNTDGLGSGRALLSYELSNAFPNGYFIAIPGRSCALVIPNDINNQEMEEVKELVSNIYKGATTPMSNEIFSPTDFIIPEQWILPVDIKYSSVLSNEILKLIA